MQVVLLFGVIWAAVLVPEWLERRRDSRPTASITSFNRKLSSLKQSTPTYDDVEYSSNYGIAPRAPGRRTRPHGGVGPDDSPAAAGGVGDVADGLTADLISELDGIQPGWADDDVDDDHDDTWSPDAWPDASTEPDDGLPTMGRLEPLGVADVRAMHPVVDDDAPHEVVEPGEPVGDVISAAGPLRAAHRRVAAMRRRRHVFFTLLGAALVTALPAVWLGSAWWAVHVVADILLFAYICLLVQRQRRLVERAEKVHVLNPAHMPESSVVVLGPANSTGTDQ